MLVYHVTLLLAGAAGTTSKFVGRNVGTADGKLIVPVVSKYATTL